MRISPSSPSPMPMDGVSADCDMPDEIEGAVMQMSQSQAKTEGAAIVRMITDASQAVNNPLPSGMVGTRINIAV